MKKIFFIGLAAAALLTACNPVQVEKDYSMDSYTPEQLADMVQFKQFSATDSVTPQEDGNWFTYTTNPTQNVVIYTLKKDGSENILSGTGSHASGSFFFRPGRGSDPNQTRYVRYVDANNDTVTAQKQVTVEVAAELTPEMRLLASNDYGSKKWVWDDTFRADQASWGNMGYLPGSGESFATEGNGIWWGMKPDAETISGQLQHATDGNGPKYAGAAYMMLDDEGGIASYTAEGELIAKGSYSVTGYDGKRHPSADGSQAEWSLGTFKTTAGSILWPYQINGKGFKPEEFELMQLDATHLKLIYAAPGTGGWSEATWWAFKSESDAKGALTDYGEKSWTWDDTFRQDGGSWGNLGYLPGTGESFAKEGNGIWWGMKPDAETISTQLQHATDGNGPKYAGGAYMTFNYDLGTVTSYTESGEKIASGSFDVPAATWFNGGRDGNNWSMGTLTTTAGSILWPYQINGKGFKPEAFEIMQLDGKHLKLIYAAPGTGSWSEATRWAFKAK